MDQHRNERDHGDHHRGQRVVAQGPIDVEAAGVDPGAESNDAAGIAGMTSVKEATDQQTAAITMKRSWRHGSRGRRAQRREQARRSGSQKGAKTAMA